MITDLIKTLYWEFLSYFVPEKQDYEVKGSCNKCGKCCETLYAVDMKDEKEFKFMQFIFPSYKRFYIKGKDSFGNYVFGCKYLKDNLCSVYDKRPLICKKYPQKKLSFYAKMPEGCGYYVEKKSFDDYLNKEKHN